MTSLADWVATHGGPISIAVIDAMYAEDPFWLERFGERGRKFAHEDGGFHIRHLVTALDIERDEVMASYARWLRSVLVARGMSSAHLADNFGRLARALAEKAPMSTADATRALTAGATALAHAHPAARLLVARESDLIDAWAKELGDGMNAEQRGDAAMVLAYVGDNLGLPATRCLAGYVAYRAKHETRRGLWSAHDTLRLRDTLVTVAHRTLPNEERNNIVDLLRTQWMGAG